MSASRKVNDTARKLFGDDVGCSDHACVFGHGGGMGTNGGCQCLKTQSLAEMRRIALKLQHIARELAK